MQHDLVKCVFIEPLSATEVYSEEARFVAMDAVECVVPDLQQLQQAAAAAIDGGVGAAYSARASEASESSFVVHLQVTLNGGQQRSVREASLGVCTCIYVYVYV